MLDQRVISFDGPKNFRDLGGYLAENGARIKWRRLYRSNKLHDLTEADAIKLEQLSIMTVVDLRTREEQRAEPSGWRTLPRNIITSARETAGSLRRAFLDDAQTPEAAHKSMLSLYRLLPSLYQNEYKTLFARLIEGDAPLLVHCTAGKDRTGVAVALILHALGISDENICEDYTMTEALLRPQRMATLGRAAMGAQSNSSDGMPFAVREIVWRSDPSYISATFAAIDEEYGSVAHYLNRQLGVGASDIRKLQQHFLE